MSNELSLGTNLINSNDCLRFGQLLWPSSERKVTFRSEEGQSSWPKQQSLLFIKLVPRESSFDIHKYVSFAVVNVAYLTICPSFKGKCS